MSTRPCRNAWVRFAVAALASALLAGPAPAKTRVFRFDIASQTLSQALRSYGQTSGQEIIFTEDLVSGVTAASVRGEFTPEAALAQLLNGTGLVAERSPSGALMIRRPAVQTAARPAPADSTSAQAAQRARTGASGFRCWISGQLNCRDAAGQEQGSLLTIGEVIVSARRREENLQVVPVSIEAISGSQMEVRSMQRVEDVVAATPNVFTVGGQTAALSGFSMRGIPNVGFFVDGIWQQNATILSQRSILELDRVELLRGPQGTLFGRDTTGGAIRLYTRRPAKEFGARLTATTGSYDRLDLTANVDVPLTASLLSKWTVAREERDGYVESLTVNRSYGEIDNRLLRADFLWTPHERFNARLILEDSLQQTSLPKWTSVIVDPGVPGVVDPGFGQIVPTHQFYVLAGYQYDNQSHASNWPGGQVGDLQTKSEFDQGHGVIVDAQAATLNLEFKLPYDIGLTALSGWRKQYSRQFNDFDGSEFEFLEQDQPSEQEWVTQEFQFSGVRQRIKWVGGLYGWYSTTEARLIRYGLNDFAFHKNGLDFAAVQATPECQAWTADSGLLPCIGIPPSQDMFTGGTEKGHAVFGELTLDLTRTLSLTLGGRYHDQKNESYSLIFTPETPRRGQIPGQILRGDYFRDAGKTGRIPITFNKDSYRFALANQFTERLMVYFGYSQGFNSGGVTRVRLDDVNDQPIDFDFFFKPESIENSEVGIRSDWLDGRLRVNATLFRTQWRDMQLRSQARNPLRPNELLAQGIISNVAAARAEGAELSVIARPIRHLRVEAGLGLLDTRYTRIDPGVTVVNLNSRFGQAPEMQYKLSLQWDAASANYGNALLALDYNWTDAYIRTYAPDLQINTYLPNYKDEQKAFGLLNFRAVYQPPSGRFQLSLFGTNLSDERYLTGGFFIPQAQMDHGTVGRPREWGLSLKAFFGGQ